MDAQESQKYFLEIVQAQAREIRALNTKLEAMQRDMDALAENDLHTLRIIAQLRNETLHTSSRGEKTIARITKIDEILKARGSTTLKELERYLKIRPQEMSRIIARLDKRRYEIFLRSGDEREKVLRLKAQIR